MNTGAMIAVFLPPALAERLAVPGGEDPGNHHVTLAFLGEADALTVGQVRKYNEVLQAVSQSFPTVQARIAGTGRFNAPEGEPEPFYASVDAPDLPDLRQTVVEALEANGLPYAKDHGFTPHVTLAYLLPGTPDPIKQLDTVAFPLPSVSLVIGDARTDYLLSGNARSFVGRPFPNEHACRLRDPGDFQQDSFRRMERKSGSKPYAVIMGRLKGESTMTEQTYRYPKDDWTSAAAKEHCTAHKGKTFEPATGAERSAPQPEPILTFEELTERFHEVFVDAMFERLRGKIDPELWAEAVKYARAKAGGHAAAEVKAKQRAEEKGREALASVINGTPISELSDNGLRSLSVLLR